MTFEEIVEQWRSFPRHPSGRRLVGSEFVPNLIAPARRGWFKACHAWVHNGPSPYDTPRELRQVIGCLGNVGRRVAKAHLVCARLVRDYWTSHTVPTNQLTDLAAASGLPLGLLCDLACELATPPDQLAARPAQQASHDVLYGDMRLADSDRSAGLYVLLVEQGHNGQQGRGVVATLSLEVVPDGAGAFYPAPALAFVDRRGGFNKAECHARAYVQRLGLWQDTWDVRWRLARRDGELPLAFVGDSLGGALALGLTRVCGTTAHSVPWVTWLQALDLTQVAITATVDSQGNLGAVGALWSKMQATAQGQGLEAALRDAARLGPLRMLVVAAAQHDAPPELLAPEAFPLRLIQAASLGQAVEKLYEEHGPRWAVRQHEREQCASLEMLNRRLPLEPHYQVLPLLQEIQPEELPRDPSTSHMPQDTDQGLHPVDILRWEEEVSSKRGSYTRVSLEQVFANFQAVVKHAPSAVPRFVVLGPPGSGKSTLVQYLAWQAARGTLPVAGPQLVPARVRLREWEVQSPQASLPEYLAMSYGERMPQEHTSAPTAEQWERWLQRGEVLLLLDGLDEVENNSPVITGLKAALSAFTASPTVLTCRTVSFEQHRALGLRVFTLPGLDTSQRDAYIRAFPPEYPEQYDSAVLITQLNRTPQMHPVTTNPLLLSIICYVVDDPQGVSLPATRGELYAKVVDMLLTRSRRVTVAYPNGQHDIPLVRKRRILERVAYTLFASLEQQRQLTFTEASLVDALTKAAEQEGYRADPAPVADALLVDLTANSGLIRGNPTQGYFFLHLTVQEFLAATALKRPVDDARPGGWKARIEGGGKTWTVQELVNEKAWDPRWQEVIVLLAGQLHDPGPLFEILEAQKNDDMFRHRLALAALCLAELTPTIRTLHDTTVNRITTAAFSLWWQHALNDIAPAVPHLTRALPSLGYVNGRISNNAAWLATMLRMTNTNDGLPLMEMLRRRLQDSDTRVLQAAVRAVEGLGSTVATADMLPRVTPHVLPPGLSFSSPPPPEQLTAARAVVKRLGRAAATADILATLADLLRDPDSFVRQAAAEAVERLESTAATADILAALVNLLRDPDTRIRWAAVKAVQGLRSAAATPEFLAALVDLLRDPDTGVQQAAVEAVGGLGSAAATTDILAALVDILRPHAPSPRGLKYPPVGRLRSMAPSWPHKVRQTTAALVGLLRPHAPSLRGLKYSPSMGLPSWDRMKRQTTAAKAVGRLGNATAIADILAALIGWLRDPDTGVRRDAVWAVEGLGSAAATTDILAALVGLLKDPDTGVRQGAARAIRGLGSAVATVATTDILAALVGLLKDPDTEARQAAAEAVGQIMEQGIQILSQRHGRLIVRSVMNLSV